METTFCYLKKSVIQLWLKAMCQPKKSSQARKNNDWHKNTRNHKEIFLIRDEKRAISAEIWKSSLKFSRREKLVSFHYNKNYFMKIFKNHTTRPTFL